MPSVLILGQAPAMQPVSIPFERTRMFSWFETVGIEKNEVIQKCSFDALIDFFPGKINGKDRVPTKQEIEDNLPRLEKIITKHKIRLIIPVGKMAIQAVLNNFEIELSEAIGKSFMLKPFGQSSQTLKIIPLPHPSGLNTWQYVEQNKELLQQALQQIKENF